MNFWPLLFFDTFVVREPKPFLDKNKSLIYASNKMISEKTLFLLIVIMLVASCNLKNGMSPINEFSNAEEIFLNGYSLQFTSDTIFDDPRDIVARGNHLYVHDNSNGEVFSILDLQTGSLIRRFAKFGNDPTTFDISAVYLSMTPNNAGLTLFQANPPLRIFRYNLDSLNADSSYAPPYVYQFTNKLDFSNIVLLNDSMVLGQMGMSDIDDNLFGVINMNTNELITGIKLSPTKNLNTEKYFSKNFIPWTRTVMESKFCQNPNDRNLFAYFSQKGAVMEIFRITDQNKFESIKSRRYYLPSFEVLDYGNGMLSPVLNKDCKFGFNSVTATDAKIYALYNGQLTKGEGFDHLLSQTILVYSWDGKPIQKILLDSPCSAIAIDPNNPNTMYALHSYKNIGVYKYTLP